MNINRGNNRGVKNIMEIGNTCYIKYKGNTWHGEIIGYDFPYYIVLLSNGLELKYYSDEIYI